MVIKAYETGEIRPICYREMMKYPANAEKVRLKVLNSGKSL